MSIQVERRERPVSGMGSRSPRFELHTRCCGNFLAADDSLATVRAHRTSIEPDKLVIYDLGEKRSL